MPREGQSNALRYRSRVNVSTPLASVPIGERPRFDRLDALRAVAMLWMATFHFFFDLNHFGVIQQNFHTDPVWKIQRICIVSLFLFCAGIGQAVAIDQRQTTARFWRRWSRVAACAALVSVGSTLMFPRSFISFGVLHGIAVMLIVMRFSAGAGRWLWLLGAVAVLAPQFLHDPWFDTRWTNWIGLVTRKPVTEDYVPVLPWLGLMWWGLAAGQWLLAERRGWLTGTLPRVLRPLATLGRWSLSFYMLHQPALIGLLALGVFINGR